MANPQEQALMTPPQPSRIKQRLPEASPFTTFLKHLPDLTPPRATTYNSYSSFAFTVQSPGPPRLASHQTPAKSRNRDQEQDGAPFSNILALADLKATPVKSAADEQDGFSYRGGETPYGLRSPIPLFHQSPRRPSGPSMGSPTPASKQLSAGGSHVATGRDGANGAPGSEARDNSARPPSLVGSLGGPPGALNSPNLISSAFAALLEGHSRSSPGGALSMLGGSGGAAAGPSRSSFAGLFSPAKAGAHRAGSSALEERQPSAAAGRDLVGGPREDCGTANGGAQENGASPCSGQQSGGGSAGVLLRQGSDAAADGQLGSGSDAETPRAQVVGGWEARREALAAAQAGLQEEDGSRARPSGSGGFRGEASVPPPPPFFVAQPSVAADGFAAQAVNGAAAATAAANVLLLNGHVGASHLQRHASLANSAGMQGTDSEAAAAAGSASELEGDGSEDEQAGEASSDVDEEYGEEGVAAGLASLAGTAGEAGRLSRARFHSRSSLPPAESPRMVQPRRQQQQQQARRESLGGAYGSAMLRRYHSVPGAPKRPRAVGGSEDSLAQGFATDDDAEPTPLVHAMLPQSPMCVPLNLDTFLPIPKLRSDDKLNLLAATSTGSPARGGPASRPAGLDSPAVKMAANAAITAALEAAVAAPASSSGASAGAGASGIAAARSARVATRAAAIQSRAAAAAAAVAPMTRRMSAGGSGRGSGGAGAAAPVVQQPISDEALIAHMLTQSNKKCNCKKSKCLKLYCDCFAAGGFCGPQCSCVGCSNRVENLGSVKAARDQIASRNPNAFKEKIEADPSVGGQHRKGCNCKKSHCMKKYCECFSAGVPCGEHCKCEGCHNTVDSHRRHPGRGRRSAPAMAGATAAQPLPAAAAAAAMRAGIPILIPGGRGMTLPPGAAAAAAAAQQRAGGIQGVRGMAPDAAAALALGGALQFLLPLTQQHQQHALQQMQLQQAAAAAAAPQATADGHVAAAGEATAANSTGPSADQAAAAANRQLTPSPNLPTGSAAAGVSTPLTAASPQMLQLYSMLQASPANAAAAGGAKQPGAAGSTGIVTSSGQIIVPLMWPFGSSSGMHTLQLPLTLPNEAQGDPTAAMRFLQQFAAQQAQQGGLAANAAAPVPSVLQPAQHGNAAALSTVIAPQGAHPAQPHPLQQQQSQQEQELQHQEQPPPAGEPTQEPHAALAEVRQLLAGSQESAADAAGSAGPLLQPALRPALPGIDLAEGKHLPAFAPGAATDDRAWHEAPQQQQHHQLPAFTFQPAKHGSELLTNSPAALAAPQLPAGLQQLPLQLQPQQAEALLQAAAASPAAVSDMDLALDSQDSPSGVDVPVAQPPLTWLQLNAVGGSGAQQALLQQQYPGEAAMAALEQALPAEGVSAPDSGDAAMQEMDPAEEQDVGGRSSTRKRTRGEGGGARQRAQRAQQAQQAPPLSPRSLSAKRKPLRTITSALE
ncbi:hypothetical protein N2152v2_000903 [Parachlorella kessleri]